MEQQSDVEDLAKDLSDNLNISEDESENPLSTSNDDLTSLESLEDLDKYIGETVNQDVSVDELKTSLGVKDDIDIDPIGGTPEAVPNISELQPEKITIPSIEQKDKKKVTTWAQKVDPEYLIHEITDLIESPAMEFEFELDNFQKQAIYFLELQQSVFVAAHTSAGKTIIAEYAIAMSQRNKSKLIYTSPIKALSNQKFREFKKRIPDVGIITGDVQISPDATCLIMTTEILRNMLYRRADMISSIEFVVFDEIHYINDPDRGVIWEEVIIMLPADVKIIMLTATVSNAVEFAEWVGKTKNKTIYVVLTTKRPVPLEHYLYCNNGLYKVMDSEGNFLSQGWKDAKNALNPPAKDKDGATCERGPNSLGNSLMDPKLKKKLESDRSARRARKRFNKLANSLKKGYGGNMTSGSNRQGDKDLLFLEIIRLLKMSVLLPAIIFTFSRKLCDEYASKIRGSLLIDEGEKTKIKSFVNKALSRLEDINRGLPQILFVTSLLERGIAVHHSGLLPIIKEIVEILFAKGLIRCLFATETFAMGVNSPAKCVIFSGVRKHDGLDTRHLLPEEYTQMSGRAGRRGMDTSGTVIINSQFNLLDTSKLRKMLQGKPRGLQSRFRLTYNMILNILRIESLSIKEIISRSFFEHSAEANVSKRIEEANAVHANSAEASITEICDICGENLDAIYSASLEIIKSQSDIMKFITRRNLTQEILNIGRVIVVRNQIYRNRLAIIAKTPYADSTNANYSSIGEEYSQTESNVKYYFNVFIVTDECQNSQSPGDGFSKYPAGFIIPIQPGEQIMRKDVISQDDITLILESVVTKESKDKVKKNKKTKKLQNTPIDDNFLKEKLLKLLQKFAEMKYQLKSAQLPTIDKSLLEARNNIARALEKYRSKRTLECPNFIKHYSIYADKAAMSQAVTQIQVLSRIASTSLEKDYTNRLNAIKKLGFIDESDIITLKGRIAIEISRAHPLITTEIIMDNVFAKYEPEVVAAILSFLLSAEKYRQQPQSRFADDSITDALNDVIEIIKKVVTVEQEFEVCTSVEEYIESLNYKMIDVVYYWAKGLPFVEVMKYTDEMEGTIVRTILYLEETCREICGIAKCISNWNLVEKMESISSKMRRDIVFSSSLYL